MGVNISDKVFNSFYDIRNNVPQSAFVYRNNNSIFNQTPIASVKINDNSDTKNKSLKQWGVGLGSLAVVLAIGSLFLTRGGSAKSIEKINSWISHLDDKLYTLGQNNKTIGSIQKAYRACINGVKKALNVVKISANFTAFKDTMCNKLTNIKFTLGKKEYKPIKTFADWCAKSSENITMKTAKKMSSSAISSADELNAYFTKYSQDILKMDGNALVEIGGKKIKVSELLNKEFAVGSKTITGRTLLEKIAELSKTVKSQADDLLNATSRTGRIDKVKSGFGTLQQDVEKSLGLKNWKNGYITENLSLKARSAQTEELAKLTRAVSNGIDDMVSQMSRSLDSVRGQILTSDLASSTSARDLSKKLKEYAKLSGSQERAQRVGLGEQITKLTKELKSNIQKGQYSAELKSTMSKDLDAILEVMQSGNQKGTLQELQTYLRILHNGEGTLYGAQKAQILGCGKAIRKASNFEQELYKRLAELKVGAALTDYGFIGLTGALGAYQVIKQDNKDDLIAASLTQGIPVFGGLGLCLYQTSKGLTGVVPLLVAFLGGKILSMIGGSVSDKYLASSNSKKQFMNELTSLKLAQKNTNVS